jgi:hypothetical protein
VQRARSRDGSLPAAKRGRVEGSGGEAEERLVANWRASDDRTQQSPSRCNTSGHLTRVFLFI